MSLLTQSPFLQLLSYVRSHRWVVVCASICSILNQVFDLLPEILLGLAVDIVVNQEYSWISLFGFKSMFGQLVFVGALCMITWTFESIFQYLYIILWRNLAQTIQHRLRVDAYTHLQRLEFAYFEDHSPGELTSILNDDVNQLERFFDNGINAIIQTIASTVFTAGIFFYASPVVALSTLAPTPFICMIAWIFQNRLAVMHTTIRRQAAILNNKLTNNILGIATIKSYTTEDYETRKLTEQSKNYMRANWQAINVFAAFRPVVRMAIVLSFVATVIVGGWYASKGIIPVGVYSSLVFLTQRLLWPFTELTEIVNDYKRSMAAAGRVLQLLHTPRFITDGGHTLAEPVQGAIEFKKVSFTYPNGTSVFKNLSFAIQAQKTTAFVGATGSGKSSIIKLLLRFYEPTDGEILLDGINIKILPLKKLRQSISFVSQEPFLFYGSLYDNIAYGSAQATEEEVIQAAKIAEAHHFIMQLPHGYNTMVGERGQRLSGGQRQRISIARAILKKAPIFALDEATAAVDNETEAAIQRSIEAISQGHTTILIAHRLSTVRHADIIHVLSDGLIVESGTHKELVNTDGMYAHLWRIQTGQQL